MQTTLRAARPLLRQRAFVPSKPVRLAVVRAASTEASAASTSGGNWEIRMLYDGECPLCMKEVNFLMSRDKGKGKIDFVDIADTNYDPAANAGITFDQAMERIHAILRDGTIVRDVEVFRRLYEAVGLGWVYAITKNESVLKVANMVYGVWAKYRMEVTGREALSVILERRRLQDKGSCRTVDGAQQCEVTTANKLS